MKDVVERLAALWAGWMGPMLVQSSLLVAAVAIVDLLLRRWAWPQVRSVLWTLVLIKLVLPPAWSLPTGIVPRLEQQFGTGIEEVWMRIAAPERPAEARLPAVAREVSTPRSTTPAAGLVAESYGPPATPRDSTPRWMVATFFMWAAGAILFAVLLAVRFAILRRWHDQERRGQTIPPWYHEILVRTAARLGISRLPAIVFSDRLLTPAVCGLVNPVLYLPRHYTESLGPEEAEHVLLHELSHVKRGDLWLHALGMLVQVAYWFNPLVAVARWQAQHVREICTDLTVAEVLRDRTEQYRATLLATARRLLTESAAPGLGLLGVFEEPFRLVARLRWLEKPTWENRRAARATAALVAMAMLVFVLPMAGNASREEVPAPGSKRVVEATAAEAAHPAEALYVRNETRRESHLLGIRVDTQLVGISELWLGEGQLSQREGGRSILVDTVHNTLTYVNHVDQTYVVASLPLDLEAILTPEVRAFLRERTTSGRVRETGRKKEILGHSCREFKVESWLIGSSAARPVAYRVYACNQVGADLNPFRLFLDCLRQLFARDVTYRNELLQIDGLQMRLVRDEGRFPWKARTVDEVVEIERRAVTVDVWAPPAGYTQQQRIARLM